MDRRQTIKYLYRLRKTGINLRLENIRYLLKKLDNPEKKLRCLHVTGTNGKGSVCAIISSILQNDNYRVGLYTSPHLQRLEERIQINSTPIPPGDLVKYTGKIKPIIDGMRDKPIGEPSFFEAVTAIALIYFADKKVDFAVLEVGLGGRLDATNVVTPLISVITNISLEHTKYLGNTIKEIASEKASIIKENSVVVTAADDPEALDVINARCDEKRCRLYVVKADTSLIRCTSDLNGSGFDFYGIYGPYSGLYTPLIGEHQVMNAATAINAVELLREYGIRISRDAIKEGLSSVKWPGRAEVISRKPYILLDGAHNPAGMHQLKKTVTKLFRYNRLILVIAISAGKDVKGMVSEISGAADLVIATGLKEVGSTGPGEIAGEFRGHNMETTIKKDVAEAIDYATSLADEKDLICITGSLYAVSEAYRSLKK